MTELLAFLRQRRPHDLEASRVMNLRGNQNSPAINLLEQIAVILLVANLWIWETFTDFNVKSYLPDVNQRLQNHLDSLNRMPETSYSGGDRSREINHRAKNYVKRLSHEERLKLVLDCEVINKYYPEMVNIRISEHEKAEIESLHSDDYEADGTPYTGEFLKDIVRQWLELHKKVDEAIKKECFGPEITTRLISILTQTMGKSIDEVYTFQDEYPSLQLPTRPDDIKEQTSQSKSSSGQSKNNAKQKRTLPVFAFLVPIICALSSIPAFFACIRMEVKQGHVTDAEFFQLISSVPMQLLGIGTSLWPIIQDLRPNRAAWVEGWTLAVISACLTIAAIPLYILVPTSWSAMSLFGGSFIQALLQLQLLLGIANQKSHID